MERDRPALELRPGLVDRCAFTLLLLSIRGDCSGAGMSLVVAVGQHQEKNCLTIDHTQIYSTSQGRSLWYGLDDHSGSAVGILVRHTHTCVSSILAVAV